MQSSLLSWLIERNVVLQEEWEELPSQERESISSLSATDDLLKALSRRHLLTPFQADTVRQGDGEDLILGQYRLLSVLGQGGMGTVYRAEHSQLRREVAVKVMTRLAEGSERLVSRFYAEARAVAKLQHPNIVTCFDVGRCQKPGPTPIFRDYFVMELIVGQDLYHLVREKGPLTPQRACDLFRQVAEALSEAHRHGLIHRDVKPSNIIVAPDWQAKVLDFGLARVPTRNVTEPGTLLGTIGYMAPEQARDPHTVDGRADLFSLGASMYWALTGREPYPETGNTLHDLQVRMTTSATPVRQLRPEVPLEISDLIERLMELDPDRRYPSARAVAATLTGFALWLPVTNVAPVSLPAAASDKSRLKRVLLVDDDDAIRRLMSQILKDHYEIHEASNAEEALSQVGCHAFDLVVVDVNLPGLSGTDLITKLRASGLDPERVKILLVSGAVPDEALGGLSTSGADDFIAKPFKPGEFLSRIRALMLRRSAGPGRTHAGNQTLRIPAAAVVRTPSAPSSPPIRPAAPSEALSLAISRLLIETSLATEGHWARIVRYVRAIAGAVTDQGEYSRLKDDAYLDLLAAVAPIYDIGLLAIPRGILMKEGRLDPDEAHVMQTHTSLGSEVLIGVAGKLGAELPSLPLAVEVARSHHERWDGGGYPDQLAGPDIPLAARVVAIVEVYEALRSRRPHRPPLPHARAVKIITSESNGQFDPALVTAFAASSARFELIHQGS
jgi:response regulator RpfG family c-di-GMP phosphodiesterase